MMIAELLLRNQDAIVGRWVDRILATYPADSSAVLKRQKDPFANPIGHSLRVGTRGIFEALLRSMKLGETGNLGETGDLSETNIEEIRRHLHEIVRIRAVQQFSPSEAVGFVFHLKDAIRAELATAMKDPRFSDEWVQLDGRIDRIALAAFDLFAQCREQVYELRLNEVKRSVSWVVDKMSRRDADSQPAADPSEESDSKIRDSQVGGCPEFAGKSR